MWYEWHGKVITVLDDLAPLKVSQHTSRRRTPPAPWLTPQLRSLMHQRKHLHKKLGKNPTNEQLRSEYHKIRAEGTNLSRRAKNEYFRTKCKSYRQQRLWRTINDLTGRLANRTPPQASLSLEQTFSHHVQDLQSTTPVSTQTSPVVTSEDSLDVFQTVSVGEVRHLLKKTDIKKASGPDDLPGFPLHYAADSLTPSLTAIINVSQQRSQVPRVFKLAAVCPVHDGDRANAGNYRPVSLLPLASKILEKVVHTQLWHFLTSKDILPPCQQARAICLSSSPLG